MKNNKRLMMLSILTLLVVMFSTSVFSLESAVLKTTLLRYEPTPAQPGDYMTAYIQVENIGDKAGSNVKVEFIDNYPFTIDDAAEKIENVGTLGIGQTYIASFKIRIDDNAIAGANKIKFMISDSQSGNIEKLFDITVQSLSTDLSLEEVAMTPREISPGESSKITLKIKNNEDSTLKQISTTLLLYTTSGTTIVDLPFAIDDSVSKKTIGILASGEERMIEYTIRSYPSIEPGIYKLPLKIDYFDATGQNFSKTELLTIIVNPKVNTYMSIERSDITKQTMTGEVVIRVVNQGFGQIKFANLKLGESDDFEILDPFSQMYIGNIDSDDYQTADFNIKANKDTIQIPVTLTYMDSLNNEYTKQETLTLNINNSSSGQKKSSTGTIIIILVIVAGAGYFVYRRMHKKR